MYTKNSLVPNFYWLIFKVCNSVYHRTIQINHQSDATTFQFTILTFIYGSTCFGRFPAHHQELDDCSGSVNKCQVSEMKNCCIFSFLKRYNFREVLAFSTNSFHLGRFLMQSFQFIFIFVISLFTSSSRLFLGLPSDLVNAGGVHSYTFFHRAVVWLTLYAPNQANLCALI
jgi:hypothetical protein